MAVQLLCGRLQTLVARQPKRMWSPVFAQPHTKDKMSNHSPITTSQKGEYVARQVSNDCIDFSVGQPSPALLPLQALVTAASHRLGSPDAELLLQYGPRQGYRSFRQSLSNFLSERYGVAVHPEHLMVTAGVSHGLGLAVSRLSQPGDIIVVEQPTYFLVTPIFRDNHLTVVPVRTDENGMVVDELEGWLQEHPSHRPRLVYTIPVHNNPRGTTLPPARRRHLMRLAAEYDFYVLADEVYQLLTFAHHGSGDRRRGGEDHDSAEGTKDRTSKSISVPDAVPPLSSGSAVDDDDASPSTAAPEPIPGPLRCYEDCDPRVSRVVSLGSFSKMLAPALRLGWLECSNPDVMERCRADGVISSGGCIAQLATGLAHSALELGLQASHLDGTVRPQLAARCTALVSGLKRHLPPGCWSPSSLVEPRGGYFVWLELLDGIDSRQLLSLAEQNQGVRFTPGPVCGGGVANCLRLAFSFYNEQELEEGARRLGAAVREYIGLQQRQQQQLQQ
ncbi:hypothetical protein Vretimale_6221 [Volvox reticuliferus]|uniref:Aminotransferase class I/classII large domain-containing protein n=1 Tax=Volvox reticuliferus TaxID=1737510 RepID=A0A8J4CFW6_9CHLO|nr:hypothetical protein Vretifemale_8031 [Volvox reticuliferus]GIM01399.1 hypothetical protein Vretimale_6221 [Volvox reticuliferus]